MPENVKSGLHILVVRIAGTFANMFFSLSRRIAGTFANMFFSLSRRIAGTFANMFFSLSRCGLVYKS